MAPSIGVSEYDLNNHRRGSLLKFLHTSDWHLGKGLKEHDLSEAQEVALNAIVDIAIERNVDAFLIAGDVFDRAFPSVDDVRRLNRVLTRIHNAGITIICTAGNHDEGARLAAFTNLLTEEVTVVGELEQVGHAVAMNDPYGPVVFYPLPYLDPDASRRALAKTPGEWLERSHEAVMVEAMDQVREDFGQRLRQNPQARAVVIAHAFVVKGDQRPEESDSERSIAVGGVPSVSTAVFQGVHYVALGHIHGPKTINEHEPMIRYSGSLLRYSVSEAHHQKSVTIVDIDGTGHCAIEVVEVPQPAGMVRLRAKFEDLLSGKYAPHYDDFVEITLMDKRIPENYYAQLSHHFGKILSVSFERSVPATSGMTVDEKAQIEDIPPIDLLRTYFERETDECLSPHMETILIDALERAQRGEVS